nr:AzlD domain-containing protein [Alkalibacter saccharofermentans]
MALITYAVRVLPMVLFSKRIKSHRVQSFLFYLPYAVLGSMTFPAILFSTGNPIFASAGMTVAILLAYMEKSLLTVALSSVTTVFIMELIFK